MLFSVARSNELRASSCYGVLEIPRNRAHNSQPFCSMASNAKASIQFVWFVKCMAITLSDFNSSHLEAAILNDEGEQDFGGQN